MPLPPDFGDEERNYRIRLCMEVDGIPLELVSAGSKIHNCDRCGVLIWVNETQKLPDAPVEIHGDVNLCMPCCQAVSAEADEPAEWLGPSPMDLGYKDPLNPTDP